MNNKSDDEEEEGEDEDKEKQKQQGEEEEEDARSISTITFSQKHAIMLAVRLPIEPMVARTAISSSWSQDYSLFVLAVLIDITTATYEWQTIQPLNNAGVRVMCHFQSELSQHDALSIFHAWGRSCKFLTRPCNWP